MPTIAAPAIPITLNGEPREVGPEAGLPGVLRLLGLDPEQPGIAVAVNDAVVPRRRWAEHRLADGDAVEVITATQGG